MHFLSSRTKRQKGSPGSSNAAQITAGEGMEKEDEDEEEGGKVNKKWRGEEYSELMDFE